MPLLKTEVTYAFFQSPEISPDHNGLSKVIRSCLIITSASSLSICRGSIVSSPTDICMLMLSKRSLTSSLSKLSLPCFRISHCSQEFVKASLTCKEGAKEGTEYFDLFCVLFNYLPGLVQQRACIFLHLTFAAG